LFPFSHSVSLPCTVTGKMGLSKSTRILILLGIDAAFFLLELIVGQFVATV